MAKTLNKPSFEATVCFNLTKRLDKTDFTKGEPLEGWERYIFELDEWKPNRKLGVEMGLRWAHRSFSVERESSQKFFLGCPDGVDPD